MKYDRLRGSTSNMVRVFIPDNTSTTGAGLTGLTSASTNLTIAYLRELDSAPVTYTGANIEAQTTIGTFQAPSTSAKCRFKEVNATSFPGVYEIQFHDSATIFGTGDASRNVQINIYEATTSALKIGPNLSEIRLIAWNMQTASIPDAVAGAAGGIAIVGSNMGSATSVTGSVGSIASGGMATLIAALLDLVDGIETGVTPRQAMKLQLAAMGGKISGGGTTTITIRNAVADSKNRIIATVDANGNRSAITYDVT
jgi:hypothetical protein